MSGEDSEFVVGTQRELAAIVGRDVSTIKTWCAKGMPYRRGHYDVAKVLQWAFCVGPWRSEQARNDILQSAIEERDG